MAGAMGMLRTYRGCSEMTWEHRPEGNKGSQHEDFQGTGQTTSGVAMACTQKEHRESSGLARGQMWATMERLREELRDLSEDVRRPDCCGDENTRL